MGISQWITFSEKCFQRANFRFKICTWTNVNWTVCVSVYCSVFCSTLPTPGLFTKPGVKCSRIRQNSTVYYRTLEQTAHWLNRRSTRSLLGTAQARGGKVAGRWNTSGGSQPAPYGFILATPPAPKPAGATIHSQEFTMATRECRLVHEINLNCLK